MSCSACDAACLAIYSLINHTWHACLVLFMTSAQVPPAPGASAETLTLCGMPLRAEVQAFVAECLSQVSFPPCTGGDTRVTLPIVFE